MQTKFSLVLALFAIGAQCRDYHYNKPVVAFRAEDGSGGQQFLTTSSRMIIPDVHGRSYEVSMSPSYDIFHMHLEHHQHHKGQQGVQGYNTQQNSYATATGQSLANVGALTQPHAQSYNAAGHQGAAVGQAYYQQNAANQGGHFNSLSANQGYGHGGELAQQNLGGLGVSSHLHYQQNAGNQIASNQHLGNVGASSHMHYQQSAANQIASNQGGYVQLDVQQNAGNPVHGYAQSHPQALISAGQNGYAQNSGNLASLSQSYNQQAPANQVSSAPYNYQQNGANTASSNQHSQQFQNSFNNNNPTARFVKQCFPNGQCVEGANDQKHQHVLQQARSHFIPAPTNCHKQQSQVQGQGYVQVQGQSPTQGSPQAYGAPAATGHKGLRDRRLFPYSEVQIPQYPYNK